MRPALRRVGSFGAWESPITAPLVAAQGVRLAEVTVWDDDVCWLEGRPSDGGRVVPVRWRDGAATDLIPAGFDARSRVHEYGGGTYVLHDESVYFTNFADGRIYRSDGQATVPVTPEGPWFYADLQLDGARNRLVCVREDHSAPDREAVTSIVAVPLNGASLVADVSILAEGHDFYSTPRLSGDGRRLAWLCWDHPRMPWDGTELRVADVAEDGTAGEPRLVAGGVEESIYQRDGSTTERCSTRAIGPAGGSCIARRSTARFLERTGSSTRRPTGPSSADRRGSSARRRGCSRPRAIWLRPIRPTAAGIWPRSRSARARSSRLRPALSPMSGLQPHPHMRTSSPRPREHLLPSSAWRSKTTASRR